MDNYYYEVTSELDAREVLRYLNHLGIHNISGQVLKHFMTDLKKLIKYDLEQTPDSSNEQNFETQGPERLHTASTFCSRIRSKTSEGTTLSCSRECQRNRKPLNVRNIHSAPNIGYQRPVQEDKPLRRACSCVRVEKKSEVLLPKDSKVTTCSNNLIKIPKPLPKKKCDPVSLYHYYTTLWAKYKTNVPGENDWADLRWNVRQKMVGSAVDQPMKKVPKCQVREKSQPLRKK